MTLSEALAEVELYGKLRVAFSAALKYHCQYGSSENPAYFNLWKDVLHGRLIKGVTLDCVAGDIFAFWYLELRCPPDLYFQVAKAFFEKLK
ncbi:MAG: hypothetical protein AABY07_00840 [Nanoarchaeota archaeon]